MQSPRALSILIGVLIALWLSAALVRMHRGGDSRRQTQVTHALR